MRADQRQQLDQFYMSVQKQAVIQAQVAIGSRDEAFDLVQDAMIKLAKSYLARANEWPQLFHRILQNTIKDYYRKQKVRKILVWWQQEDQTGTASESAAHNPYEQAASEKTSEPEFSKHAHELQSKLANALSMLPLRQQQAFMLRAWWQLDTQETAQAMSCSAGSVKTHYSRALSKLRAELGDFESMLV